MAHLSVTGKRIALYFLVTSLGLPLLTFILGWENYAFAGDPLLCLLVSLISFLSLYLIFGFAPSTWKSINSQPLRVKRFILLIPIFAFLNPISLFSAAFYGLTGASCDQSGLATNPLVVIFSFGVLGPLEEEIFFRGVVFNFFRKKMKLIFAIILSALIFSLSHLNPAAYFHTFVFGLVSAYIYFRWGNLWYPFVLHLLTNNTFAICELLLHLP